MVFIVVISVLVYFVLIAWAWHSLGDIPKSKKISTIIITLLAMAFVTLIIFNISKNGLNYENSSAETAVRNVLVAVFTGLNGIIFIPQFAKILGKISQNEINKEMASKKFLIWTIIFIICVIIECKYMKSIQEGILSIYMNAHN